jgi:hypothetical protein
VRFDFRVKPGRKLIDQGASSCTDAEILAIILGSGGRDYSALDAARAVLERYGTLADLMDPPSMRSPISAGVKPCVRFGSRRSMNSANDCSKKSTVTRDEKI